MSGDLSRELEAGPEILEEDPVDINGNEDPDSYEPSTTAKGYFADREEYLKVPFTVIHGTEGEWTDLSDVYELWDEKYDRQNTTYLWSALNELYHGGIIEADEFLGATKLKVKDKYWENGDRVMDDLPEPAGEYAGGTWARKSEELEKPEFGDIELPALPWEVFSEHAERHGYEVEEIHRGDMEGVVAEKESEYGDKLTRYGVANRSDRDRVGISVLFRLPKESAPGNDDLFSDRHRDNYLERIWGREIQSMINRFNRIYESAEDAVESLDPETSYTEAVGESLRNITGLRTGWSSMVDEAVARNGADFDEQVEQILDLYYPQAGLDDLDSNSVDMGRMRPGGVLIPFSEFAENQGNMEGTLPLGESLRTSDTGQGLNSRNRLYLEKYLDAVMALAREKDR